MIKIENYFPLVKKIVKKYENTGVEKEDLFQEGCIGLIKAKNNYKEGMNVNFSTYATYWIKKYIIQSIEKSKKQKIFLKKESFLNIYYNFPSQISLPSINELNLNLLSKIEKKVIEKFYLEQKTLNDISKELNIPREKVRQIKQKSLIKLKKFHKNLTNPLKKINKKSVTYI
ncbi:MAG: sigma-70 family RNA polymerase sigma factor [Candidatus Omnitrophica bacterium]|nr:sigma-70 family RNA polymerase sigma factor [Candidatus Omnitrophota bacterium]